MMWKSRLVLWALLYTQPRCQGNISEAFLFKNTFFSDKISDCIDCILYEMEISMISCASRCNLHSRCMSIFYHRQDKFCQLNLQMVDQLNLLSYNGSTYYQKRDSGVGSQGVPLDNYLVQYCNPTKTFLGASNTCSVNGGRLAVADTMEKLLAVKNFTLSLGVDADFYLGATGGPANGFHWSNGVSIMQSMWREYEPSNISEEPCITMHPFYLNGLLNDDSCTNLKCFVCEYVY